MLQEEVGFDFPNPHGPYEYVLLNALGPLWIACILLFLAGVYFLARRERYRVVSRSLLHLMKLALAIEAFSCCVFGAFFAYGLSSYAASADDLVTSFIVFIPCILGSICWAYSLRRSRVEPQFMSILKLSRK
ncbi:MAG: hypothetical protein LAO31_12870 [Acidobacteriia bacterium]|nr:hypothetical protein [Terriglobia bacterium]